ncbi:hypothetical protein V2J09_013621 [Rumex salicifolius]
MKNGYEVNDRVEIIGAEEGLCGSYHMAFIMEHLRPVGYYRIRYELLTGEDASPLIEVVPVGLIRPIPPKSCQIFVVVGDHVDMWNRDGWWYALIQDAVDAETHRYVYEKCILVDQPVEIMGYVPNMLRSFYTAEVKKVLPMIGWFRVEYNRLLDEDGTRITEVVSERVIRFRPPLHTRRNFRVGEHVDVWDKEGWWHEIVKQKLDDMYEIDFFDFGHKNAIVVETRIRRHMHHDVGMWLYIMASRSGVKGRSADKSFT